MTWLKKFYLKIILLNFLFFFTSGLFEFSFSSSLSSRESTSESNSTKQFRFNKLDCFFFLHEIYIPVIVPSLLKTIRRLLRTIRFIDDTLGNLSAGHMPSF